MKYVLVYLSLGDRSKSDVRKEVTKDQWNAVMGNNLNRSIATSIVIRGVLYGYVRR